MSNTLRKLREAEYFLKQLDVENPYFDYILSAYLNAARSINWIMRNEFHDKNGWKEWYEKYKVTDKENDLLKKINELRIKSTKQEGVKTDFYFLGSDFLVEEEQYKRVAQIKDLPDGEYIFKIVALEDDEAVLLSDEAIQFTGKIDRINHPNTNEREKLLQLCQSYYELMVRIVNECYAEFKN